MKTKRFWMLSLLLIGALSSCTEDEKIDPIEQNVTLCEITAPTDGAEIFLTEEGFQIRGEAAVDRGEIASVELKVDGVVIATVDAVPFLYDYRFSGSEEVGELDITLTVTGDAGAEATDHVTVNLVEKLVEQQAIQASLTTPELGYTWVSNTPLPIAGIAEINRGSITEVVLKVGDEVIEEVTEVPFAYSYVAPEGLPEGALNISLLLNGDEGATALVSVDVVHQLPAENPNPIEPILGTMTDSRDGKTYKTVTLGTQVWMAENLAWLPAVYPSSTAADSGTEKRYFVLFYEGDNVEEAKQKEEYAAYGVLYNWYAANDTDNHDQAPESVVPSGVRGACPEGWHLPSMAEWQLMEAWVGSQIEDVIGESWIDDWGEEHYEEGLKNVWSALAALDVWGESLNTDVYPDLVNGPRDTFGFSAVPAGFCWHTGAFEFRENETGFWATEYQQYGGACVEMKNLQYGLYYTKSGYQDRRGYSVRCVQD